MLQHLLQALLHLLIHYFLVDSSIPFPSYATHGPIPTAVPQAAQRYSASTTSSGGYPIPPSYQAWSGYDFGNNGQDHHQHQHQHTDAAAPPTAHCMSAPTTPMNEDAPHLSYFQGQQHPYAVSPSYATLTGRSRDPSQRDTLHHQSTEQYEYDQRQPFQSWEPSYQVAPQSPSSHEDHFYPNQDNDFRKSSSVASGMPIFNNPTPPSITAYQYSPDLGDETPSPISSSYPTTNSDYLSYHDQNHKHARRYSIGGGMYYFGPT